MPPRKPLEAQPFSLPLWLGGLVIGTALGLVVRSRLPAGVRAVSFDADGRQGVRADEATRSARLVGGTRLPHLAAKEESGGPAWIRTRLEVLHDLCVTAPPPGRDGR